MPYRLELEECPKLIFVSVDGEKVAVYIDGLVLSGVRKIKIAAEVGGIMTHEVEFITKYSSK